MPGHIFPQVNKIYRTTKTVTTHICALYLAFLLVQILNTVVFQADHHIIQHSHSLTSYHAIYGHSCLHTYICIIFFTVTPDSES